MKSFCITDIGIKRKQNQDFVYASDQAVGPLSNLYIVADGMGGHNAGDYASRCTVETMVEYIENARERRPVRLLEESILKANDAVCRKAASDPVLSGMGTTVVACTVQDGCLYIANVGDSRLYILEEKIEQITRDHSLVEEMVRAGQITKEDARNHPDKNMITRAIGMKNNLHPDLFDVALTPGDRCLLCSDGLTNMIKDADILKIVGEEPDLESAGRKLVETANNNGGSDNISVVLIEPESGD